MATVPRRDAVSEALTASVESVLAHDSAARQVEIVGYRWVLHARNGRPLAQQVRHSVSQRAAWQAFRLFCREAQDISDEPWEPVQ